MEEIMRLIILAAASFLILGSAAAQDKATFQKLQDDLISAGRRGDFAALGGMYTEDAYVLQPGSPMMRGRSNIEAYWTKANERIADLKNTTVDVEALGSDAVREIGTYRLVRKGQEAQPVTGVYVNIWQKVGNKWEMSLDIWTRDK
jgi:ketosteroid isomerase-like protein